MNRYYDLRKGKGLCVVCGKRKSVNNNVRCEICYNKMVEYNKNVREDRRKDNKCLLCGGEKTFRDLKANGEYYTNCYKCRDYKNKLAKIRKQEKINGGGINE